MKNINLIMDAEGGDGHEVSKSAQQQQQPLFLLAAGRIVILFGVIIVTCFLLNRWSYSSQFFPRGSYNPLAQSTSTDFSSSSSSSSSLPPPTLASKGLPKLENVLKKAAMDDKTVIITTLNEAWAAPNSIFELFLESFRIGNGTEKLLNHLVVIALDQKAYDRCLALHSHCYALKSVDVDLSSEAYFMTPIYLEMMWRRIDFLRSILEIGYNFIFTDTDVMWFRDPFPRFYVDADFQIACDRYWHEPLNLKNAPNGGFNFVKSNNRTIQFYKFWYKSRKTYPGLHDQDVLNRIKFDPFLNDVGLKIWFLDTAYFGGFCQPSKDLNQVCTMHANCCFGLANKVHDLKILLDDWRKYSSLSTDLRIAQPVSWRAPQNCSL